MKSGDFAETSHNTGIAPSVHGNSLIHDYPFIKIISKLLSEMSQVDADNDDLS